MSGPVDRVESIPCRSGTVRRYRTGNPHIKRISLPPRPAGDDLAPADTIDVLIPAAISHLLQAVRPRPSRIAIPCETEMIMQGQPSAAPMLSRSLFLYGNIEAGSG